MNQYWVICERDEDGWWVGRVSGIAGVLTQGRSLATIKTRIRDALSLAVDGADKAEIFLKVKLDAPTRAKITALTAARKDLEKHLRHAKKLERQIARALAEDMSLRDAGVVLNLTGQRVQQLAAEYERDHS